MQELAWSQRAPRILEEYLDAALQHDEEFVRVPVDMGQRSRRPRRDEDMEEGVVTTRGFTGGEKVEPLPQDPVTLQDHCDRRSDLEQQEQLDRHARERLDEIVARIEDSLDVRTKIGCGRAIRRKHSLLAAACRDTSGHAYPAARVGFSAR
jgi:hypothetical protein